MLTTSTPSHSPPKCVAMKWCWHAPGITQKAMALVYIDFSAHINTPTAHAEFINTILGISVWWCVQCVWWCVQSVWCNSHLWRKRNQQLDLINWDSPAGWVQIIKGTYLTNRYITSLFLAPSTVHDLGISVCSVCGGCAECVVQLICGGREISNWTR